MSRWHVVPLHKERLDAPGPAGRNRTIWHRERIVGRSRDRLAVTRIRVTPGGLLSVFKMQLADSSVMASLAG